MGSRGPLIPVWVIIAVVLVVLGVWVVVVIAALRNPQNSGALIPVTGLLTMVLGAAFGYADRIFAKKTEEQAPAKDEAK